MSLVVAAMQSMMPYISRRRWPRGNIFGISSRYGARKQSSICSLDATGLRVSKYDSEPIYVLRSPVKSSGLFRFLELVISIIRG